MSKLQDFRMKTIDGQERSLGDYDGKVLLVVNVASKCGLTPQYEGLQALYEKYNGRGFEVLGFPCNQFMGQEPGSDAEVQEFCTTKFGVSFPMFSKIDVNGPGRAPLYDWLCNEATQPEGPGDVKWNFGKFLLSRSGEVLGRFEPPTDPSDAALTGAVEEALG